MLATGAPAEPRPPRVTRLAWLRQRRMGVLAGVVVVFGLSLGTITLLELVGDRPLSGETDGGGRTSVGALFDRGGGDSGTSGEDDPGTPTTVQTTVPTTAPGAVGEPPSTVTTAPGRDPRTTTPSAPTTTSTTAPSTTTSTTSTTDPTAPPTSAPQPTTPTTVPPSGAG
jgi:hypothetical protein